jgi:parvulin-like peptidyl-prolyl isomerase
MDSLFAQVNIMHRLSHILVGDEATARSLLDSLEAGVPFAELAKRHSQDSTSADQTGDLGWAKKGSFVPEFETAVDGLSKGETAGPLETKDGWHLILLTDVRTETLGQSERMQQAVVEAIMRDRVMTIMGEYIASLKEKHGVVVNNALLSSLDYATSDPAIQAELKSSEAVLTELPHRTLTVRGLSFKIRFQYFHGTEGKDDADEIRDRIFWDWVSELVLRYEAMKRGYQNRPEIVYQEDKLERKLLREAVLEIILDFPFDPSPQEIESYYSDHQGEYMAKPQIKVRGVLLADEEAALQFRKKLEEGASVSWLAERSPGVVDADPVALSGWLNVEDLGVIDRVIERGTIIGPFGIEEAWAVAKTVSAGSARPIPLEECRSRVVQDMLGERRSESIRTALDLLQSQGEVEIEDGAHELIESRVGEWLGVSISSGEQ